MRQTKTAADQAAIAEQRFDFFRRGTGGDVEILGVAADQQIADRAADQIGAKAGFAQAVQHAQRVGADVLARNGVLIAWDDAQRERRCN
ncbi:hypothetical protein XVE_2677 [Xanthomonas vesicatoria ATCC 35937]|uniref:Uncharacterized protein n=1 Tax=Xanthomonas vesicatoria ATCC 35937 TaxID=925775 RepID=F0BEP9_9XANT|nr:hypothetical protein XVE_2677 [Xanthomonas vesicatoria ATCC 35937]